MANCLKSRIYIRLEPPDWEALWYLGCDPEVIRLGLEPRTPTLKVLFSTPLNSGRLSHLNLAEPSI